MLDKHSLSILQGIIVSFLLLKSCKSLHRLFHNNVFFPWLLFNSYSTFQLNHSVKLLVCVLAFFEAGFHYVLDAGLEPTLTLNPILDPWGLGL